MGFQTTCGLLQFHFMSVWKYNVNKFQYTVLLLFEAQPRSWTLKEKLALAEKQNKNYWVHQPENTATVALLSWP